MSSQINRPHFRWVYRRDKPRGMLGEKLVNHEPKARDLQAFWVQDAQCNTEESP